MTTKSNDKQQKDKTVSAKDNKATPKKEAASENSVVEKNLPAETPSPQDVDAMIDWASAMQEQNATQNTSNSQATPAASAVFPPLVANTTVQSSLNIEALKDVPVQITVELGRASMTVREILQLGQGSVVELDSLAGEPLDILINGHLIAQGEVVVVGENYGVRLTDISSVSDRLSRYTKNS
jgi:flagellar motor switch protein FliN/FliY